MKEYYERVKRSSGSGKKTNKQNSLNWGIMTIFLKAQGPGDSIRCDYDNASVI